MTKIEARKHYLTRANETVFVAHRRDDGSEFPFIGYAGAETLLSWSESGISSDGDHDIVCACDETGKPEPRKRVLIVRHEFPPELVSLLRDISRHLDETVYARRYERARAPKSDSQRSGEFSHWLG